VTAPSGGCSSSSATRCSAPERPRRAPRTLTGTPSFGYVNQQAKAHLAAGQPVVSVDTKKKELVGNYANGGVEWQPVGEPERVLVHDFPDPELGKAIPYGVYDLGAGTGWVSVGCDHDTAAFAVATLRRWWERVGQAAYPRCRLFSQISMSWRGRPLLSYSASRIGPNGEPRPQPPAPSSQPRIYFGHQAPGAHAWVAVPPRRSEGLGSGLPRTVSAHVGTPV
jgi:hypothetical protein